MKVAVAKELKLPGTIGKAEWSEDIGSMEYGSGTIIFAKPVHVSLTYSFDGEGFSADGTLSTAFRSRCSRCTKEFTESFEASFSERFERDAEPESETYSFKGDELEMDDLVRDTILLNRQAYSLCKPDCRGLCPKCGHDLNTSQCSCDDKSNAAENPFASLGALLKDDKEV